MKKYILAAIAVIILMPVMLILTLPFWFGREAEKTYQYLLDQLSAHGGTRITASHYERGWLSSTAETTLRHRQIPLAFKARHRISHGPFPLDRILGGDWRLTPFQARITSELSFVALGNNDTSSWPPLSAETTVRVNGDGIVHVEMPHIKTTGAKGEIIDWHGMTADLTLDRAWRKIQFTAHLPSLKVTAPGKAGEMAISDVSLHSNTQEGASGYLFGEGGLRVGELEIGQTSGRVGAKGLALSASTQPADDNVNMVLRYSLDEAHVAEERFGPGIMVFEARRLDVASLVKFKKEIEAIDRDGSLAPRIALTVAGKTVALLAELAKKAPEFEITRLSFKTREGEISGKAKFVLDGRKRNLTDSPVKLLTTLRGNLEILIPEPLLKRLIAAAIRRDIEAYRQSGALTAGEMARLDADTMTVIVDRAFPQYLTRHEVTRLLVKDGGQYKLDLSIARGQVMINGKPWHAPARIVLPR